MTVSSFLHGGFLSEDSVGGFGLQSLGKLRIGFGSTRVHTYIYLIQASWLRTDNRENKLRQHTGKANKSHRSRIRYLNQKKFVNFNEFSEIEKIRKNSYKKSLNARVGVAFQWNSLLI